MKNTTKSIACLGTTDKGTPCKQRCAIGKGRYCRFHITQNRTTPVDTIDISSESIESESVSDSTGIISVSLKGETSSESDSIEYVKTTLPPHTSVCSICLCDTDDEAAEERCILECGHSYHMLCIKKWIETASVNSNECCVCRRPISFSAKPIEIDTRLKDRNELLRHAEMINTDEAYARDVQQQDHRRDVEGMLPGHNDHDGADIHRAIEESIALFEMNDYNLIADVLEQSYHYTEIEEEKLIQEALDISLQEDYLANVSRESESGFTETGKDSSVEESFSETIERLMQGKESVTIKLKSR